MEKSDQETIEKFNELVNMTLEELQAWMDSDTGDQDGQESSSLRKIVEFLKKNPNKDPKIYDEDDLAFMREVVTYISQHLAEQVHIQEQSEEELEKADSTISLRNWGHDPVKTKKGKPVAAPEPASTSNDVEAATGTSEKEEDSLKRKAEADVEAPTAEESKPESENVDKPKSNTKKPPAKKAKTNKEGAKRTKKKADKEVTQGTRKSTRTPKPVDYRE